MTKNLSSKLLTCPRLKCSKMFCETKGQILKKIKYDFMKVLGPMWKGFEAALSR